MTNPAFLTLLSDAIARAIPADTDQGTAARQAGLTKARTLLEARERHNADPPLQRRDVSEALIPATRRAVRCGETALHAVGPTVLAAA